MTDKKKKKKTQILFVLLALTHLKIKHLSSLLPSLNFPDFHPVLQLACPILFGGIRAWGCAWNCFLLLLFAYSFSLPPFASLGFSLLIFASNSFSRCCFLASPLWHVSPVAAVPRGCLHIGVGAHGHSPSGCTYPLCHGDLPPGVHLQQPPVSFLTRLSCAREEQFVFWQICLAMEVLLGCPCRIWACFLSSPEDAVPLGWAYGFCMSFIVFPIVRYFFLLT